VKPGRPRNLVLLIAAMIVLGAGTAWAVTTVTAKLTFVTDLTVTTNNGPVFGYVKAATIGTYVLSTGGVVTPSGGGVLEGGTGVNAPAAGSYTIKGSGSQLINISDGNYQANGSSTPSAGTCKYGGAASGSCNQAGLAAPTAVGTTLLVGLQVNTSAGGVDGTTDSPHFDLTVVYQ
jgi:hypothetical protein